LKPAILFDVLKSDRAIPLPPALAPPGCGVSMTSVLPSQYIGVRSKVFSGMPQLVLAADKHRWVELSSIKSHILPPKNVIILKYACKYALCNITIHFLGEMREGQKWDVSCGKHCGDSSILDVIHMTLCDRTRLFQNHTYRHTTATHPNTASSGVSVKWEI